MCSLTILILNNIFKKSSSNIVNILPIGFYKVFIYFYKVNFDVYFLNECVLFWLGANASNRHYTCEYTYVLYEKTNFYFINKCLCGDLV